MVVSFLKNIGVSNHQVVHIKFIECYMSTLSQEVGGKPIDSHSVGFPVLQDLWPDVSQKS